MKIRWNRKYNTIAVYALLVICAAILFYLITSRLEITVTFLTKIRDLLLPFAYAFSIAYLLNPLVKWLERRVFFFINKKKPRQKMVRLLSVIVAYLLLFSVIALSMTIIIPQMVSNITVISRNFNGYYNNAEKLARELLLNIGLSADVVQKQIDSVGQYLTTLFDQSANLIADALPYLYGITRSFTTAILNIFIGVVASIYVLMSKERIFAMTKKMMYAIFNEDFANRTIDITRSSNRIFSGFISGKIIDSLIVGVICFIGMVIFQFPYALLISVIIGVSNIIPYFGPIVGAVPSILIILVINPMQGLGFAIFILILQQFDGNILGPRILGDSTGLSPLWVMFAIIVGGGLFGVMGMFVGVPVFSVLYMLTKQYLNSRLANKGMSIRTADYASEKHPIPLEKQNITGDKE